MLEGLLQLWGLIAAFSLEGWWHVVLNLLSWDFLGIGRRIPKWKPKQQQNIS